MNNMKFIKFCQLFDIKDFFVFFSNSVQHSDMSRRFGSKHPNAHPKNDRYLVNSAGFLLFGKEQVTVFGKSVSLRDLEADENDNELLKNIKSFNYIILDNVGRYSLDTLIMVPDYIPLELLKESVANNSFFKDIYQEGQIINQDGQYIDPKNPKLKPIR